VSALRKKILFFSFVSAALGQCPDQFPPNSCRVNEEMIESLFICNPANAAAKEAAKRPVLPTPKAENKVLDPKKAQNIAILLRALNVTKEEVCDALCEGE
jgi:flagellar biosynthesis protein FliP